MLDRTLEIPKRSFFLFGPRATGKSTWLKHKLPGAFRFDLLKNDTYFKLSSSPNEFRETVTALPVDRWIIVDEVQRIPSLLNEVHSLIEDHGYKFALTGSSARKLKREKANLLAGRALVRNFFPFTHREIGDMRSWNEILQWGCLPAVVTSPDDRLDILEAYAGTYLREEIKEEALTRNVGAFARFMEVASIANGQVTNLANISRDAHVSRATLDTYFSILEDTLLGRFLPAWTPKIRMKETAHPKFFFFDTGVLRAIQGRLRDRPTEIEKGHLFETYLFHELVSHSSYANIGGDWSYWRTADGVEIDFIWRRSDKVVAIEAKASSRWKPEYDAGMMGLLDSKIRPLRCVGVYLGTERLKKKWGEVLPIGEFLAQLYAGKVLPDN